MMIRILLFTLLYLFLVSGVQGQQETIKIILDTDISSDVDDVGAVAVAHALANQGKAEILATMVSSGDPWSGPCLDALNTWFGRPDIPVGVIKEPTVTHESKYTREIATSYPNKQGKVASRPGAVELYRKLLSSQPDQSVTIITIGYLTNLKNLLNSVSDEFSPLNGYDLVNRKVRRLVCMGGHYPKGREWNFYQDSSASSNVIANWPGPIIYIGYEAGLAVETGSGLKHVLKPNPLSRSYELYNGLTDRPSWDQLAVLFSAMNADLETEQTGLFTIIRGINSVAPDGSNRWRNKADGRDGYVVLQTSEMKLKTLIEEMMIEAVQQVLYSRQ